MFLARAVSRLRSLIATPSSSSNGATRTHSNRVDWTLDVEVNEIARTVNCGKGFGRGCGKNCHECKCFRKRRYNSRMPATFATFTSQIPSEVPPPTSLATRIANFINDSFVADAPLINAGAAISVPAEVVDADTSANSTVQRRSKRTLSRQPSNNAEPISVEAEEANV
ncbi:hypothetical protein ACHAWO_009559 [Cyclotella atomus]|uniref:Uncharacterized protein n=1 Tax=Cyclotella atomus TaxID=382360 RepID=A0ABD3N2D2_9STRA